MYVVTCWTLCSPSFDGNWPAPNFVLTGETGVDCSIMQYEHHKTIQQKKSLFLWWPTNENKRVTAYKWTWQIRVTFSDACMINILADHVHVVTTTHKGQTVSETMS